MSGPKKTAASHGMNKADLLLAVQELGNNSPFPGKLEAAVRRQLLREAASAQTVRCCAPESRERSEAFATASLKALVDSTGLCLAMIQTLWQEPGLLRIVQVLLRHCKSIAIKEQDLAIMGQQTLYLEAAATACFLENGRTEEPMP